MRKHIPLFIAAGVLAAAGSAFGVTQAFAKDVTLVVDGQSQKVRTWDAKVSDVLADKGITVGEHDVVTPEPDAPLQDNAAVTVSYGRELRVKVNGKEQVHWTTATNVQDALAALKLHGGENARLSVSRSATIGRDGLSFTLDSPQPLTLVVGGKSQTIEAAGTVADALAAAHVVPGPNDIVDPAQNTPLSQGLKIKVIKVDSKKETTTSEIAFTVTKVDDATMAQGDTKVKTPGVVGSVVEEWAIVTHDGKVVKKTKIREISRTEPKAQVLLVGTKATPAPKPDTSGSGQGSINWDKLAQCEAGGNWAINTGNGYYGGLQFSAQTWESFGGTKYAATANLASKAQQIEIGEKVLKSQGLNAWPGCTAKGMY